MRQEINEIKILNQDDEVVAVLSNDGGADSTPFFSDLVKEKRNDPYASFEFEAPADTEAAEFLIVENKVALQHLDGTFRLYRIKQAEDRGGEYNLRYVFAEAESLDLLNTWVKPQTFAGQSIQQMLNTVLAGARYEPGIIEWDGVRTHTVENYMTAVEFILEIRALFGGDIRYRVDIAGTRITGRYVDYLERLGKDEGRRFEYEKNLEGITRIENTQELATALIGVGASLDGGGFVDFTSVDWNTAKGDPVNKPAGQNWVGDFDALQQWGIEGRHLVRLYRDDNEKDPAALLKKTWAELQRRKNPAVTFEARLILLERLAGYETESAHLGDTIRVLDYSYNPPILLEARIDELTWSPTDPEKDQAVLGDYRPRLSRQYAAIKELQNTLQTNRGTWDAAFKIYSAPQPPLNPEDGTYWQDTGTPAPWYIYTWDATAAAWIATGATQASDLGAVDIDTARGIAQEEAAEYVDNNAEPIFHIGPTEPADKTAKWLDTSQKPYILKVWDGDSWEKATPTTAAEVGADPAGSAEDAKNEVMEYAQKRIYRGTGAPTDPPPEAGDLWIDETNAAKPVYRQFDGTSWKYLTTWSLQDLIGQISNGQIKDGAITPLKIDYLDATLIETGVLKGITVEVDNAGITNADTAATAVRIWAGALYTNRNTAPFRVQQDGKVIATNIDIQGGNINIANNANIGNNLYLGQLGSSAFKYIYFHNATRIYSDGARIVMNGNFSLVGGGNAAVLYNDGAAIYADCTIFESTAGNNYFQNVNVQGQIIESGSERIRSAAETGYCGVGGMTTGITSAIAGNGVNFRAKKNYTPSSISLGSTANNLISASHIHAIDISANGFWLYVDGGSTSNAYRYWRGNYTA